MRKNNPRGIPFEKVLYEHLKDPEFKKAYGGLKEEFETISKCIKRGDWYVSSHSYRRVSRKRV